MERHRPEASDDRYGQVLRHMRGRILLSALGLWGERLAQGFWPLATLLLATYAFAAFDGFSYLPPLMAKGLFAGLVLAGAGLLVRGASGFRRPTWGQALARLDATDPHRPLAALRDHMAAGAGDPLRDRLWQRYQGRMAVLAGRLEVPAPRPDLPARDPAGLRLMALVLALLAVVFAPLGPRDLLHRSGLAGPSVVTVDGLSLEAWATPPPYSGQPAIYLPDLPAGQLLSVPQGTELVVRVYGLAKGLEMQDGVSGRHVPLSGKDASLQTATLPVTQAGRVVVKAGRDLLANWNFAIAPDAPPVVAFDGPPSRGGGGGGGMLLPFKASDDMGVQSGTATITLELAAVDRRYGLQAEPVPRDAIVLDLPMPFSGDARDFSDTLRADLDKHVWANLPVRITLSVTDVAGQQNAPVQTLTYLPARVFYVPLAAAIAEQRRDILWSPDNDKRALNVLRAVSYRPADLGLSAGRYLILRAAIRRFARLSRDGLSPQERADVAEDLWNVAVLLEDGALGDARAQLRRAQDRLSQALEQGADSQTLDRLGEELKQAIEDYLQALTQEAQQQPPPQTGQTPPQLDDKTLQGLLDQMQKLMEQGQNRDAQQMLDQLGQMLENLQVVPGKNPSAETLQQLQEALKEQQDLADETYRKLQQGAQNGEIPSQDLQDLADRQQALRDYLDRLGQQPGGDQPALDEAEKNMDGAQQSLQNGDINGGLDQQAEALENLREGIRQLGEQMQQAQGQNGTQPDGTGAAGSDPLGRPLGETGRSETGETLLQEQKNLDRAQQLLNEIRRRAGEQSRPESEREYLKRLMDRF